MTNTLKPRSVQSNGVASTDRVVPLSVFDDSIVKRRALICSTLLFDGVLDVQMLRAGLEKLIELKGWNKLGARLRRNVSHELKSEAEKCLTFDFLHSTQLVLSSIIFPSLSPEIGLPSAFTIWYTPQSGPNIP